MAAGVSYAQGHKLPGSVCPLLPLDKTDRNKQQCGGKEDWRVGEAEAG